MGSGRLDGLAGRGRSQYDPQADGAKAVDDEAGGVDHVVTGGVVRFAFRHNNLDLVRVLFTWTEMQGLLRANAVLSIGPCAGTRGHSRFGGCELDDNGHVG